MTHSFCRTATYSYSRQLMNASRMSDPDHSSAGGSSDWMRDSSLLKRWREIKAVVEVQKWLESEKAGYDIGWNRAWTRCVMFHGEAFSHDVAAGGPEKP